ncbi:hypothetical protein A606_10390 [Corynebacterium terpenotabidum Y-11]|uniref:Two-component system sensor kinase n=1 Tax=Corynebacterium terpenotabidum Y-11 TaxID=1200352 RepID=S4XF02_9CORY|nr:hypothetical protein A606_10390 [Corynebacterium terpenotabidum Y-11]
MRVTMLRIVALVIICAWPVAFIITLAPGIAVTEQTAADPTTTTTGGWVSGNWYVITTALLFIGAEICLLITWLRGRTGELIVALRLTAATLVVAVLLLVFRPDSGHDGGAPGLWFSAFTVIPAIAFALTAPPVATVGYVLSVSGTAAVANAVIRGTDSIAEFIAYVGHTLIIAVYLCVIVSGALRIGRSVDLAEESAWRNSIRANRQRARDGEMARFTAQIHDDVLSHLSSIADRVVPQSRHDLRLAFTTSATLDVSPEHVVDTATRAVEDITPDCRIITTIDPEARSVPTAVASPMLMALAEVARNSARHAGDGATRECRIVIGPARMDLTYCDDGAGFTMADLRPTAAGLRISVQGRMDAVDGGAVQISSTPGEGTTIRLTWEGTSPDPVEDAPSDVLDRTVLWEHLGLNAVMYALFGVSVVGVFAAMAVAADSASTPVTVVTWILLAVATALVMPGDSAPLRSWQAASVVVVLWVALAVGVWQEPEGDATWLSQWHLAAVAFVALLLPTRRRPWHAVVVVGGGIVLLTVLTLAGIGPTDYHNELQFAVASIIVVASVAVVVRVQSFLWRVPAASEVLRHAAQEKAAADEVTQRRAENLRMLELTAGPVFTAASRSGEVSEALSRRARLTELQLRDMIRSPLLNLPVLREAVWDARARGVTVLLLDDRSGRTPTGDAPVVIDRLLGDILYALDVATPGDHVTVRLLPAGREAFATVRDSAGLVRYDASGGRLPERADP